VKFLPAKATGVRGSPAPEYAKPDEKEPFAYTLVVAERSVRA